MLSIALGIELVSGLNLINQTVTHEVMWITFCSNMVISLETVSRGLLTV
jgi:hypothetical protein